LLLARIRTRLRTIQPGDNVDLIDEMERESFGPVQRALAAEARSNPAMAPDIYRRWRQVRRRANTQRRLRAPTIPMEAR
jgi:hypothetical protein